MLRPYQITAIEKTREALRTYERVVLTAATGAGKSLIIAEIVGNYLKANTGRVLILCHQAEILLQNQKRIAEKGIATSIYCAALNQKDFVARCVLASRESAASVRSIIIKQKYEFIIVDECHLVSSEKKTMYQKIFTACEPKWLLGLTGSPYRLDNGVIFGRNKFWQAQSCAITTEDLQSEGYLSHHIFPRTETIIDTSKVKLSGAEFNLQELDKVSRTPDVVTMCIAEWWRVARDRKLTFVFCVSIAHAMIVATEMKKYTKDVELIHGETDMKIRQKIFDDCRNGRLKAVVNVGVLTTGIDVPLTDCILLLRATQSLSLFIQMVGRGLRVSPNKDNCLILDFAGNWVRFGGLANPLVPRLGSTKTLEDGAYEKALAMLGIKESKVLEAPKKACPECKSKMATAVKKCVDCGHVFINHAVSAFKTTKEFWENKGYHVGKLSQFVLTKRSNRAGNYYIEFWGIIGNAKVITALPVNAPEMWIRGNARRKYNELMKAKIKDAPTFLAYKRESNGFTNIEIVGE